MAASSRGEAWHTLGPEEERVDASIDARRGLNNSDPFFKQILQKGELSWMRDRMETLPRLLGNWESPYGSDIDLIRRDYAGVYGEGTPSLMTQLARLLTWGEIEDALLSLGKDADAFFTKKGEGGKGSAPQVPYAVRGGAIYGRNPGPAVFDPAHQWGVHTDGGMEVMACCGRKLGSPGCWIPLSEGEFGVVRPYRVWYHEVDALLNEIAQNLAYEVADFVRQKIETGTAFLDSRRYAGLDEEIRSIVASVAGTVKLVYDAFIDDMTDRLDDSRKQIRSPEKLLSPERRTQLLRLVHLVDTFNRPQIPCPSLPRDQGEILKNVFGYYALSRVFTEETLNVVLFDVEGGGKLRVQLLRPKEFDVARIERLIDEVTGKVDAKIIRVLRALILLIGGRVKIVPADRLQNVSAKPLEMFRTAGGSNIERLERYFQIYEKTTEQASLFDQQLIELQRATNYTIKNGANVAQLVDKANSVSIPTLTPLPNIDDIVDGALELDERVKRNTVPVVDDRMRNAIAEARAFGKQMRENGYPQGSNRLLLLIENADFARKSYEERAGEEARFLNLVSPVAEQVYRRTAKVDTARNNANEALRILEAARLDLEPEFEQFLLEERRKAEERARVEEERKQREAEEEARRRAEREERARLEEERRRQEEALRKEEAQLRELERQKDLKYSNELALLQNVVNWVNIPTSTTAEREKFAYESYAAIRALSEYTQNRKVMERDKSVDIGFTDGYENIMQIGATKGFIKETNFILYIPEAINYKTTVSARRFASKKYRNLYLGDTTTDPQFIKSVFRTFLETLAAVGLEAKFVEKLERFKTSLETFQTKIPLQPATIEVITGALDYSVSVADITVAQPKLRDGPEGQLLSLSFQKWERNSCWVDSLYSALFSIPETALTNTIFSSKTINTPVLRLQFPNGMEERVSGKDRTCGDDVVRNLHESVLLDIRDNQLPQDTMTGTSCRAIDKWRAALGCVSATPPIKEETRKGEPAALLESLISIYNLGKIVEYVPGPVFDQDSDNVAALNSVFSPEFPTTTKEYVFFELVGSDVAEKAIRTAARTFNVAFTVGDYRLSGLIVHQPDHYVAFTFDFLKNKWAHFNNLAERGGWVEDVLRENMDVETGLPATIFQSDLGFNGGVLSHIIYTSKTEITRLLALKTRLFEFAPVIDAITTENQITAQIAFDAVPKDSQDCIVVGLYRGEMLSAGDYLQYIRNIIEDPTRDASDISRIAFLLQALPKDYLQKAKAIFGLE